MFIVGVLLLGTYGFVASQEEDDESFPNINELFGATANYPDFLPQGYFETDGLLGARKSNLKTGGAGIALPPNVHVDIEKLDVKRFKSKLQSFQQSLIPRNGTNDTRKWSWWPFPIFEKSIIWRREVDRHNMKLRLMELMLQLIYQAKARLDNINLQPGFSSSDPSFRIAFLFTRMRELRRAILQIYNTQIDKQDKMVAMKPWGCANYFIYMHMKAVQKYSDFIYLYKIAVGLHRWKEEKEGVGNTLPSYVRQYIWDVSRQKSKWARDKTKITYPDTTTPSS